MASSPIQLRNVRRMNSSPSLTTNRVHIAQEALSPKDVSQFVQNAARLSSDLESMAASHTSIHEVLLDQLRDTQLSNGESPPENFDLEPPSTANSRIDAAALSSRLFSTEHLQLILLDRTFCSRFSGFLQKFKPKYAPVLERYQATQKAKAAVEYANAVAQALPSLSRGSVGDLSPAASFESKFENRLREAERTLVEEALPAYINHRLVILVTECLVKEITGTWVPMMKDVVQNLAEVYCLTDVSAPDNPIIFASEEFYHTTQYGMDYVIGRNCRFLNGPDTSTATRKRISEHLQAGKDVCEVVLNYKRDGTPFMNLLMIAPLYDNKGRVRYFIGAQIDVTQLIEGGRGLDSFQLLLAKDNAERKFGHAVKRRSCLALGELGQMLSPEEMDLLKSKIAIAEAESPSTLQARPPTRRHIGMDDPEEKSPWPLPHIGPSLPGVYQNYLLVRPYPSLRITFTSPALRIPGLVQSRLMSRIGGANHVREGILEALRDGVSVTAKVSWLAHAANNETEAATRAEGKPRWLHCTPLLGADYKIGVWMIVIVEQEEITGSLNVHQTQQPTRLQMGSRPRNHSDLERSTTLTERRLYAQYLRGTARQTNQAVQHGSSMRSFDIDSSVTS